MDLHGTERAECLKWASMIDQLMEASVLEVLGKISYRDGDAGLVAGRVSLRAEPDKPERWGMLQHVPHLLREVLLGHVKPSVQIAQRPSNLLLLHERVELPNGQKRFPLCEYLVHGNLCECWGVDD